MPTEEESQVTGIVVMVVIFVLVLGSILLDFKWLDIIYLLSISACLCHYLYFKKQA